ncbi:unnamed protein product, partial [marine sediment metagenome]
HGISSAYTNGPKVIGGRLIIDDGIGAFYMQDGETTSSRSPQTISYDDTRLYATRGGNTGTFTIKIFVKYIL